MRKPMLFVWEQVSPAPSPRHRYRIVETIITMDGHRTRVTHESFALLEDAQQFIQGCEMAAEVVWNSCDE